MSTTVVGPFVLDVRWGEVGAPLGGSGTRTQYFAMFGLVFRIRDIGGWSA
jgi:hypothetical protein